MQRVLLRFAIIATVSGSALATASSVTAAAPAGPAKAPRPGHWTQVTFADLENFTDIGLVRGPNGVLHVLWTDGNQNAMVVRDTPILANGTVRKPVPITGHLGTATFPDATRSGRTMYAFWNQTPTRGGAVGTAVASWPANAHGWKVTTVKPAQNTNWDFGVAAATGADGKPWVAFVDGGGFEVWHNGHATRQVPVSGCCVYQAGIGADSRTSTAWLTWFSNITNHFGIEAQRLNQSGVRVGRSLHMPGSSSGNAAVSTDERTTATGLGHHLPGVYLTYLTGYPTSQKVKLMKLGAKRPTTVATRFGTSGSTLAADPSGRLWVAWFVSGQNPTIWLRRAGSGASRFGPTIRLSVPRGTSTLWKIYLNAQANRVDVLALVSIGSRKPAYFATQVLPPR